VSDRLMNKVALVTGGGSGIGEAVCRRFAEEGAAVVVADINGDSARKVAGDIIRTGGKAIARTQDVTDALLWGSLVDDIATELGGLDVLVNNAGMASICPIEDETLDGWRRMHAVNTESVFLGTQAAINAMKSKGGSIINVSSIMGIIGEMLEPAYCSSKGGVRIFSKSAALHCASKDYNIRVNSVHPGFIATPMVAEAAASLGEEEGQELTNRVLSGIPMKRLGDAVDIANGCLFLASDESSYVTGTELVIDGGCTAQ
jgi:3(or 17)beta-hydroxysteroid dehydrogenase